MQLQQIIYTSENDLEIAKAIKKEIKEYLNSIKVEGGKDFFVKHTKKMDEFVSLIYKYILKKTFQEFKPHFNNIPISIIALGSYVREQLSIYSDIDIMIVYKEIKGYNLKEIIENYITMLWDLGLKIGHRVHELKDLFPASNEDITIKTALMEARFITGSNFTWQATSRELEKIRLYKQKEFILAKITEAQVRRKKHPRTMEPNIKESVGGLRDAQLLFWIANSIYNIGSLKDLSGIVFTEDEYKEYRVALELLYRVRSALHLIANKQEDKLQLAYMPEVTKLLGFKNTQKMSSKVFYVSFQGSPYSFLNYEG